MNGEDDTTELMNRCMASGGVETARACLSVQYGHGETLALDWADTTETEHEARDEPESDVPSFPSCNLIDFVEFCRIGRHFLSAVSVISLQDECCPRFMQVES